jgi:excisionase family DNA binding protein
MGHALKASDLARLLGVTHQHIYRQAAKGSIPSFRVGAAVRFDPAAVAEWLERKMLPRHASAASPTKIAV